MASNCIVDSAEALECASQQSDSSAASATRSVSALGAAWVRLLSPANGPRVIHQSHSKQQFQRQRAPSLTCESAAAEPEERPSWRRRPDSTRVQLLTALELDAGAQWSSRAPAGPIVFGDPRDLIPIYSSSLRTLQSLCTSTAGASALSCSREGLTSDWSSSSISSSNKLHRSAATSGYLSLSSARSSNIIDNHRSSWSSNVQSEKHLLKHFEEDSSLQLA